MNLDTSPAHILFITQTPEYGGAERHLVDFIHRLDSHVNCTVLCFSEDFYSEPLKHRSNVRVVRVPLVTRRRLWSFWRIFRHYPATVIVLVKGIFDHYPLSAYLAARLSGRRRLVVLEHLIADPLPERKTGNGLTGTLRRLAGWRTRYRMGRKLQGYLTHVTVCVSEAIRRRLTKEFGYPEDRTITIRNGIDLQRYTAVHRVADRPVPDHHWTLTIVCAARLSSVKRLDLLLDALSILRRSHSNWRCLILGTGPLQAELVEQARRLSLLDYVSFEGQVEDVREYLSRSDLFVLSSEKEGLPLALLEAMAAGLPAVVTDVGGTGEVVVHGQTGLLVKAGSSDELERAIAYLLVHHEERRRMGQAAQLHAKRFFDIEDSMAKLKHIVLSD